MKLRSRPIAKSGKKRKIFRRKSFWAILVFFVVVVFRVSQEFKSVRSETLSSWRQQVQADCGIVLTGGAGRVREGFDLLANQNIKKLIISGVYQNARLREIIPSWPFYGAVKEEDVVLERHSETTYGNAQQSLAIVEALGCRDIILVTSRLHMYRSYRTFKATFPQHIHIYKQPVVSLRYQAGFWDTLNEAFKSLFYSTWVYS